MLNKTAKITLVSVTGTMGMTLFSYLLSALESENFNEPEHLGEMLNRISPLVSKNKSYAAGWIGHYAIGQLFAAAYVKLWESGKQRPSFINALFLGSISGGLAVLAWKAAFKMHPAPPWVNHNKYFKQLVVAHVVFTIGCSLAYKALKQHKQSKQFINAKLDQ